MKLRLMNRPGVYRITNILTGKVYIGSASHTIRARWYAHTSYLDRGIHQNRHLQRSWKKYGRSVFVIKVLRNCAAPDCLKWEQFYIDRAIQRGQQLYNIYTIAGSPAGIKRSLEYRRNMSRSTKGRTFTLQHRENLRKANTGVVFSLSRRRNISRALKGKPLKAITRHRIGLAHRGVPKSLEHAANISKALKAYHARRRLQSGKS